MDRALQTVSWLGLESSNAQIAGLNTPFVVAFAIIGLVLAVLITANVVSATVVAGYRRIGVLKSIGFTPAQVAASYLGQIGMPAMAGAIAGTALGDWWVLPELNGGPFAAQPVPLWINITVPLGLLALAGLVALIPARRAGRLSAVAAMAAGQAPRTGHGYAAHRLAARLLRSVAGICDVHGTALLAWVRGRHLVRNTEVRGKARPGASGERCIRVAAGG